MKQFCQIPWKKFLEEILIAYLHKNHRIFAYINITTFEQMIRTRRQGIQNTNQRMHTRSIHSVRSSPSQRYQQQQA